VRVAKLGEGHVFNELYRRHAERVFRVARRIARRPEDAEDAVQESFLSAHIHLRSFEGRAKFSTWLTRIAVNAALMKVRKNRISRELPLEDLTESLDQIPHQNLIDPSPNPERACAAVEEGTWLRNAIAQLRPAPRMAVEIYLLQDGLLPETAKVLGISISATKGRLFHAKLQLRKSARQKRRTHGESEHIRRHFHHIFACTLKFVLGITVGTPEVGHRLAATSGERLPRHDWRS
jgi:RNA polymerase sigma-70 factor, ECF subfamily